MPAPWFFAPPEAWQDDEIILPPEESHHALKVLRIAPPDVITVTDGAGVVARCAASRTQGEFLVAHVLERETRRRLRPEIVVYQGAPKGSKGDDIVERLAELGVIELWMYESERAVVKWDERKIERSTERWRQIARSAAKQSRNPYLLDAGGYLSWTALVRKITKEAFTIVLWEEAGLPLRTALSGQSDRIALVVGPEGGLARGEAEQLADAGGQLVSLGPRILRTENAAFAATSAVLFHYGLIG